MLLSVATSSPVVLLSLSLAGLIVCSMNFHAISRNVTGLRLCLSRDDCVRMQAALLAEQRESQGKASQANQLSMSIAQLQKQQEEGALREAALEQVRWSLFSLSVMS